MVQKHRSVVASYEQTWLFDMHTLFQTQFPSLRTHQAQEVRPSLVQGQASLACIGCLGSFPGVPGSVAGVLGACKSLSTRVLRVHGTTLEAYWFLIVALQTPTLC